MNRISRCLTCGIALVSMIVSAGCDAGEAMGEVGRLTHTLIQNKELVEQFVKDVKRDIPPDDPRYSQVRGLYEKARAVNDSYLGDVALSGLTGDRASGIQVEATAAHVATAEFAQSATRSLDRDGETRGLPIALAIAAYPSLSHQLMKYLQSKKKVAPEVQSVVGKVRWRSWESLEDTNAR